jgi:hypothetical protein
MQWLVLGNRQNKFVIIDKKETDKRTWVITYKLLQGETKHGSHLILYALCCFFIIVHQFNDQTLTIRVEFSEKSI